MTARWLKPQPGRQHGGFAGVLRACAARVRYELHNVMCQGGSTVNYRDGPGFQVQATAGTPAKPSCQIQMLPACISLARFDARHKTLTSLAASMASMIWPTGLPPSPSHRSGMFDAARPLRIP